MGLRFNPVIVPDAATYSVKDYNSGILHIIPNLTADITITLPTPEDGLTYRFWYGGLAADAQDWIFVTGADNSVYYIGGVMHIDEDSSGAEAASVYSDGNSNSELTILTPASGTEIEFICNGTNWYVNGQGVSASASGVAFADQS